MGEDSSPSISVEDAAWILMSMSSSSSSSFPINFRNDSLPSSFPTDLSSSPFTTDSPSSSLPRNRIYPPRCWTTTKKRTRTISDDDSLVEEVIRYFDSLQFDKRHNLERSLELVKDKYKSNKEIVAGIESFEYLLSERLDGNEMLEVLNEICNNRVKKRKIKVELEQPEEDLAPIIMKNKKQQKQKNIAGLVRYECKEVFADYRALDGHIASHNRKKKIEEEKDCIYETGQTVENEKTRSEEQQMVKFEFDLNDSPDDHIAE